MKDLHQRVKTQQQILNKAASVQREVGTDGIGIAVMMKCMGLTHNSFYAPGEERLPTQAAEHVQALSEAVNADRLADSYLADEPCFYPAQSAFSPALDVKVTHLPPPASCWHSIAPALNSAQGMTP